MEPNKRGQEIQIAYFMIRISADPNQTLEIWEHTKVACKTVQKYQ